MKQYEDVVAFLGEPYVIKQIDGAPAIYRDLDNGYSFEVFYGTGMPKPFIINV